MADEDVPRCMCGAPAVYRVTNAALGFDVCACRGHFMNLVPPGDVVEALPPWKPVLRYVQVAPAPEPTR